MIPKDAQVRGGFGRICRASAAIITEVLGLFGGEPVGIPVWDKVTTYYTGNEVIVKILITGTKNVQVVSISLVLAKKLKDIKLFCLVNGLIFETV